MRKVIKLQMELWKKDIPQKKFGLKSKDEIAKLLMGYSTYTVLQEKLNSRCTRNRMFLKMQLTGYCF